MASQETRLSRFKADFKQQQSEMTNQIDTLLKAITDRIAGALPSDMVKNLKLNINTTTLVLSAHSYPTEDPQCSAHIHGSINAIEEEEREREGGPKDTNTIAYNEKQRDTPQLKREDITAFDNLGLNKDDEGIEWLDVEEALDLVDISEKSVYESLIKDMAKWTCSSYVDIPCTSGYTFSVGVLLVCNGFVLSCFMILDLDAFIF
ncbi:hypothetical protein Tco_0513948 [Tanacetum coccineum]